MKPFIRLADSHEKHGSSKAAYEVVLPHAILWHFCLGFPPKVLNSICVHFCLWVKMIYRMVHSEVLEPFLFQAIVSTLAITNACSAWLHFFFYYW